MYGLPTSKWKQQKLFLYIHVDISSIILLPEGAGCFSLF